MKYKYVIESNRKFTDRETDRLCQTFKPQFYYPAFIEQGAYNVTNMMNFSQHISEYRLALCQNYVKNEFAQVTIRIDGSSYLRHIQSLSMSTADKIGAIGGTLGLFSGFSFLVLFEIFHWAWMTVQKLVAKSPTSIQPLDPITEKMKGIEQENETLKSKVAKIEELLAQKEVVKKPSDVVVTELNA